MNQMNRTLAHWAARLTVATLLSTGAMVDTGCSMPSCGGGKGGGGNGAAAAPVPPPGTPDGTGARDATPSAPAPYQPTPAEVKQTDDWYRNDLQDHQKELDQWLAGKGPNPTAAQQQFYDNNQAFIQGSLDSLSPNGRGISEATLNDAL